MAAIRRGCQTSPDQILINLYPQTGALGERDESLLVRQRRISHDAEPVPVIADRPPVLGLALANSGKLERVLDRPQAGYRRSMASKGVFLPLDLAAQRSMGLILLNAVEVVRRSDEDLIIHGHRTGQCQAVQPAHSENLECGS